MKIINNSNEISVKKEIVIDGDFNQVFSLIQDFSHWHLWNPWLALEPTATVRISQKTTDEKDAWFQLEGNEIGTIYIKHLEIIEEAAIKQSWTINSLLDLEFEGLWLFERVGKSTKLSWQTKLSYSFLQKAKMKNFVDILEEDITRGLDAIASCIDPSLERYLITEKLPLRKKEQLYITKSFSGSLETLYSSMDLLFDDLYAFARRNSLSFSSPRCCFYHNRTSSPSEVKCSLAIPVKEDSKIESSEYKILKIPEHITFTTQLTGDYIHLSKLWGVSLGGLLRKNLKTSTLPPSEVFYTAPSRVDSKEEWITEVRIPIKSDLNR